MDHVLLVFMKLRLSFMNVDLLQRYCVPFSTVSKIFRRWLLILASYIKNLIIWPSREAISGNPT